MYRHTRLTMQVKKESWPMAKPFRIAGYCFDTVDAVVVGLTCDGRTGWGESNGVYYKGDSSEKIIADLERCRSAIEAGIDRGSLLSLMPPCSARNAVDCALWDLEAKLSDRPAWRAAGLTETPRGLITTFTCGADRPEIMAAVAQSYEGAQALKLKLTGDEGDAERVWSVRTACPDVWIGVDANQGFTRASFETILPVLVECDVRLIEQPFQVGEDHLCDGLASPIPLAADESAQDLSDLPSLKGRYDVVNIKLDKCGGLTEGLAMAAAARALGMLPMVGNMLGTSLSMAPAWLLGQFCEFVDLDGPMLLAADRAETVTYERGTITCPETLWGS